MTPCPQCHLSFQCICAQLPQCSSQLQLALLTHENEFTRETNTGHWLAQSLPHCHRYRWSRVSPPEDLLQQLANPNVTPYLIFPSEMSVDIGTQWQSSAHCPSQVLFIILDGTWQEARKMWRQSPWLHTLPQVHITPNQESIYKLRRNQDSGHLCTLEVGCELLKAVGESHHAQALHQFFAYSMQAFHADKSGHALQQEK